MSVNMIPKEFIKRQKEIYEADAPRREKRKQYLAERNRLAKAAPDMLTALQGLLDRIIVCGSVARDTPEYRAALAAYDKAKGR